MDTPLLRIMDSFHSPNYIQTILNDFDLVDTHRPFQQDCPPSLLEQLNIRLVLLYSLCLSFPASVQQGKALKRYPRCVKQPDYAVLYLPEIYWKPELGTPRYKGTKCWFPLVSVIEGLHCSFIYVTVYTG